MSAERMHPDDLATLADLIADRLAERLRGEPPAAARLLTAAEVAALLGTSRDWVYANRQRLGAVPLGAGKRPRLRFDPAVVALESDRRTSGGAGRGSVADDRPMGAGVRGRRARGQGEPGAQLLPIRGRDA